MARVSAVAGRRAKLAALLHCMSIDRMERQLIAVVRRLADPPEVQAAYLRELGSYPSLDELALEFDDVRDAALLNADPAWAEAIHALDAQLSAMSSRTDAVLWNGDSLHRDEWQRVRALAATALRVRSRGP
jgi:hypothetical protein